MIDLLPEVPRACALNVPAHQRRRNGPIGTRGYGSVVFQAAYTGVGLPPLPALSVTHQATVKSVAGQFGISTVCGAVDDLLADDSITVVDTTMNSRRIHRHHGVTVVE